MGQVVGPCAVDVPNGRTGLRRGDLARAGVPSWHQLYVVLVVRNRAGYTFFTFGVPNDMEAFESAQIVLLPESSSTGAETYEVFIEVKRNGEVVSTADWAIDTNAATTVDDNLLEVDISAQLAAELNPSSPGNDIVSVFFWFPGPGTADTDGRAIGMRFVYDSIHQPDVNTVSSPTVIDNSLTQDDLAPSSVGAAEIADNSIGTLDVADGSLIGADILNGSISGIDITPENITASHIAVGAVGSAEITDGSVNSTDILDEAGADFASGDDVAWPLTAADTTVRSVAIFPPSAGRVIVNASGYFSFRSTGDDAARCSITTGTAVDFTRLIITGDIGSSVNFMPFASTRGFLPGLGGATFRLVCNEVSGAVLVEDISMTAIFVPTAY